MPLQRSSASRREADAYELTTRAEAEAEANRKIAESLTEALIAYTYAENWNGELPTFMTGDGATLPMFDMSAPAEWHGR